MTHHAAIPAASLTTANDTLQSGGFGPGNFSRALGLLGVTTHYGYSHAANDAAFRAATASIPGVLIDDDGLFHDKLAGWVLELIL